MKKIHSLFAVKKSTFWLILLLTIVLSGCNIPFLNRNSESGSEEIEEVSLSEVLGGKHLVPLIQNGSIYLVDADNPQPKEVYTFQPQEAPITFNVQDIKISPNHKYLVWYSPQTGFISYSFSSQKTQVIRQANQWLSNNPFFQFDETGDLVFFVDNEGTKLYTYNLTSSQITSIDIPFPFGNLFKVSPNGDYILFISGFKQTSNKPEYMITTSVGTEPIRFESDGPINKRQFVEWLPDSSGIITLSNQNELFLHPRTNPANISIFYTHADEAVIDNLYRVENNLYFSTSNAQWHVIDTQTQEAVGRIPVEIAQDIHRPQFLPWYDQQFLIVETIRTYPHQFNRLWVSNHLGVKTMIMDKYQEIQIADDTPRL